jgi:hypothetical protein
MASGTNGFNRRGQWRLGDYPADPAPYALIVVLASLLVEPRQVQRLLARWRGKGDPDLRRRDEESRRATARA